MAIEFHCEHCGKQVRAQDDSGGRHGKCPSCHQTVYIPMPDDRVEPLDLEPVDEAAERERERLLRESADQHLRVLSDREPAAESSGGARRSKPAREPAPPAVDLEHMVIEYVQRMANGELERAEQLGEQIHRHWRVAEGIVDRLSVDEIPPQALSEIPRPVLLGFLKQLRASA